MSFVSLKTSRASRVPDDMIGDKYPWETYVYPSLSEP